MSVQTHAVRNALVYRDDVHTHRWYDAHGERVSKYLQDFIAWPVDDTSHDPTEWTNTIVEVGAGVSTADLTDLAGGALLITTAANENDGYKMQLGHASTGAGENVDLSGRFPLYCGIEFAISDATQSDVLFGVAVTDTTVLDGVTDGMYFRKVDASTALTFVTEKNSVESVTAVATLANATYVKAEFLYDVDGYVYVYINDSLVTTVANSVATFPNDELMRLTLEFLAGEAAAKTLTVRSLRMIHVR